MVIMIKSTKFKMTLKQYFQKRNLKKSGEPEEKKIKSSKKKINHEYKLKGKIMRRKPIRCPRFVVHEHSASHLHWDLRLEMNGTLKSWAIPKEPPIKKDIKRLAILVEDHPLSYANFEGTIPEGNYGAGTVKIWDKGTYELEKKLPKEIIINFFGKKLKGKYVLIKTKYGNKPEKSWLFFKH